MLVSRISEIGNFTSLEKPTGWLVREKFNEECKAVGLEMGCYLKEDVFISVPIHFSLKDKLIPMPTEGTKEFKYYAIPTDMQLAVSTYTNKKGKVCPILVAPNKDRGVNPTFIACLARDVMSPNVILHAELGEGAQVVRKYVDKERSVIGIIAFKTDRGVINPSIEINITAGAIGSHTLESYSYQFATLAPTTVFDSENVEEPIATKFINLPAFTDSMNDKKKYHNGQNKRFNNRHENNHNNSEK